MQAVPVSVARMNAKAAQLAAELDLAREGACDKPGSGCFGRECSKDVPPSPTAAAAGAAASSSARLQGTLAGQRRMSQANLTVKLQNTDAATLSALAQCQRLESEVQLWKAKHNESEQELQRHQESYMRREEQLRERLAELEQRLQQAGQEEDACADSAAAGDDVEADTSASADNCSSSLSGTRRLQAKAAAQPLTLEAVQQQMHRGLEDLLQHQRLQLRAEEAAQLRQFRGRLAEVEAQLAADKRAAAADQDSWMSKTVAVREELARTQAIAVKLDAMYRLAEDEAARLRVQFKAQEDDRQHLIRQVLGLRRHNKQLQQQVGALQEELDAIMALEPDGDSTTAGSPHQHPQPDHVSGWRLHTAAAGVSHTHHARPVTAGPQHLQQQQHNAGNERILQQLQRALQCERKQLRQLRAAYTAELGRRNDLQTLLMDSIQQAKQQYQQVAAAHAAQLQGAQPVGCGGNSAMPPQQQQQQQPWLQLPGSSSVPAGPQRRPASAAARPSTCSSSGRSLQPASWGGWCASHGSSGASARPQMAAAGAAVDAPSVKPGAAASSAADAQLDDAAWARLLQELLSRQQLLEVLLQRAFPEFVAAAQQLHQQGQHGTGQLPGVQQPPVGLLHNQGPQQLGQSATLLQAQEAGQTVEGQGQRLGSNAQEEDMFAIQEVDGGSPLAGSGSDSGCEPAPREGVVAAEGLCEQECIDDLSVQRQPQHTEQQHKQLQQQEHTQLQQEQPSQPLVQQQHPQQQPWWQPQLEVFPAQQQRSSSSAASPPHSPAVTAAAAAAAAQQHGAAAVTLASMGGPLMGAFPVRKLLHSGSSTGSSQRASSSRPASGSLQHRRQQQHARPESAVAGSRCSTGAIDLGQAALGLRPMSAALAAAGAGAGAAEAGSQPASWQQCSPVSGAAASQQRRVPAVNSGSSRQQHGTSSGSPTQCGARGHSMGSAGGHDGLSIFSWANSDSKAAQQMLKSFLAGRQ